MKRNNPTTQNRIVDDSNQNMRIRLRPFGMLTLAIIGTCAMGCLDKDMFETSPGNQTLEPGTFSETISVNGENREFIMYVPTSYDGNTALPIFLNFHGFGGTASDFMAETNMRSLAEEENFILVYPQGSLLDGSPHWNSALSGGDNKSSTDDFGFVEAMIDEIAASYNADTDRVYAAGYSNGGFMAYALACYRSDLVTGIGSVSGSMMEGSLQDCNPDHPTAMINIHGTSDYVVPYSGGNGLIAIDEVMDYWIDVNGTSGTAETDSRNGVDHIAHSGGDGGVAVEHYRVNGGEHVWFERDFNGASTGQLIWDFVSRYDRDGLIE